MPGMVRAEMTGTTGCLGSLEEFLRRKKERGIRGKKKKRETNRLNKKAQNMGKRRRKTNKHAKLLPDKRHQGQIILDMDIHGRFSR